MEYSHFRLILDVKLSTEGVAPIPTRPAWGPGQKMLNLSEINDCTRCVHSIKLIVNFEVGHFPSLSHPPPEDS